VVRIIRFFELFPIGKRHGLSPRAMDSGDADPWWTDHHGLSGGLLELGLAAAPGHGGLP
jgi:hypothetical protein